MTDAGDGALGNEEGEECCFSDPRVTAEAAEVANAVRPRLAAHRRRVQAALRIYVLAGVALVFWAERNGVDLVIKGWPGLLVGIVAPSPLLAIIIWRVRGEKMLKRQVYQEQRLHCTKCGRACQGMGDDDALDWIMARACPHCGGVAQRYPNG